MHLGSKEKKDIPSALGCELGLPKVGLGGCGKWGGLVHSLPSLFSPAAPASLSKLQKTSSPQREDSGVWPEDPKVRYVTISTVIF